MHTIMTKTLKSLCPFSGMPSHWGPKIRHKKRPQPPVQKKTNPNSRSQKHKQQQQQQGQQQQQQGKRKAVGADPEQVSIQ